MNVATRPTSVSKHVASDLIYSTESWEPRRGRGELVGTSGADENGEQIGVCCLCANVSSPAEIRLPTVVRTY